MKSKGTPELPVNKGFAGDFVFLNCQRRDITPMIYTVVLPVIYVVIYPFTV